MKSSPVRGVIGKFTRNEQYNTVEIQSSPLSIPLMSPNAMERMPRVARRLEEITPQLEGGGAGSVGAGAAGRLSVADLVEGVVIPPGAEGAFKTNGFLQM